MIQCVVENMPTVTYLNYYLNGMWNRKKVRSFENNKVTLGSKEPGVDFFTQVKKGRSTRLMSYELGVAPFFLIDGGKIWIDSKKEPIFDSKGTRILFARATKNGLIFIHEGYEKTGMSEKRTGLLICSVSLDGNAVRIGNNVPLSFTRLSKIAPFQSFNPTPSKFHSLNDISSMNLPIGRRGKEEDGYHFVEYHSIGRDGLLPPIVIKDECVGRDEDPMKLEYKLNHFSKDISTKVKIKNDGRIYARFHNEGIEADSFWFTEEPIVVNRETDKQRDD